MLNTKRFCFVILQLMFLHFSYAQNDVDWEQVLQASPTAAEFGKVGLVNQNLLTGSAGIHLPLFDFTTKDLSLAVSLNYSGNGLKVDQLASVLMVSSPHT